MIKKILTTRVSATAVILGMALAELAHIYLNHQFNNIF